MSDLSVADQDFQRYVTDVVWSTWARPGLSRRERSLIVLAMSAALSQMPEFELHVVGAVRNGLAEHDLRELVMQVVAYCGAPAGVQAKRALMRALDGMADQPG
ncbi:carboxymuconolactone decarboxylase family protein [Streptomyces sp. NBC_00988]|uniref:carboxymuconolactone decarboxylase family protein n=1 Tax=Streptomyces sp. NBC_00988 TaxID=2903704 RepID=UPI003867F5D1|nr:carboxymuconolactone decarboxylase family protein [Streptomyces sp. NBC_00988]